MKNFFDYTDEKITEKAFMQCLVMSVAGILVCIISLCSITYAWFNNSISGGNNVLKSGSFDLEIKAVDGTPAEVVFTKSNGVWNGEFAPGTYTVTLTMTETSNVKGHCAITIGDKMYHTEVMSKPPADGQAETLATITPLEELTFNLKIQEPENVTIEFVPRWGIPAMQEGAVTINNKCEITVNSDMITITYKNNSTR